jgi:hypothetical protein
MKERRVVKEEGDKQRENLNCSDEDQEKEKKREERKERKERKDREKREKKKGSRSNSVGSRRVTARLEKDHSFFLLKVCTQPSI